MPELNTPADQPVRFSESPFTQIAPDVYLAVAEPASVNIGLVVGQDHALLIDTGSAPEQGARLAAAAAELAGRPVDRVVITHAHFDHFFGLAGVGSPESVGHTSLIEAMADQAGLAQECSRLGIDPGSLSQVTQPISVVKAIDLGGVRAEVVHFGKGHTAGDLVVIIPERQVIFTGDLLEVGADPQFGPDSTVETWPSALDGAVGSATDDTLFVPGHGAPVGRQEVFMQRADVSTIYGQAEQLVARGIRLDQALAALDQPTLADGTPNPAASEWEWPFSTDTIRTALPLAYAELAGHGQTPRTQLTMVSLDRQA